MLTDAFEYTAGKPILTGIEPSWGEAAGGTSVEVSGQNLTTVTAIFIGGAPLEYMVVVNDELITGETPAHDEGVVDVEASGVGEPSNPLTNGYTYVDSPRIDSIEPIRRIVLRPTRLACLASQTTRRIIKCGS